jgi:cephalosporin hydroxylase
MYQEIIFKNRPDIIIEAGTSWGGTALFLANMCDLIGNGRVITIDVKNKKKRREHKRITYLLGSSTDKEVVKKIKESIGENDKVMVILDSRHHKYHVDKEIEIYHPIVSVGQYLVVEETILNGHPIHPDFGPGPMEAVEEFMKNNKDFIIDKDMENHYITFSRNGFLKKVR